MIKKKWVSVTAEIDEDGNKKPTAIKFDDSVYLIDKVVDVKLRPSFKAGGVGERYTIMISGQMTYVYCEGGRWFVEEKERTRN